MWKGNKIKGNREGGTAKERIKSEEYLIRKRGENKFNRGDAVIC